MLSVNFRIFRLIAVSLSQQQTGRLRRLIERVRAFSAGCCWGGRPLGSVILWEKHKAALERILHIASSITITQVVYYFTQYKLFSIIKDIKWQKIVFLKLKFCESNNLSLFFFV